MAILTLPTRPIAPEFSYSIDLDGKTYRLAYRWNERATAWHLDIMTAAGAVLLRALPLAVNFPLLTGYRSRVELPPGELVVVDLEGRGENPGRDSLGQRFELLYYEVADYAALLAGTGA
jgi:hypothetical protein